MKGTMVFYRNAAGSYQHGGAYSYLILGHSEYRDPSF